ncbi:sugar transferase [Streptomyces sp. MRC013]|uniref:sugar transferase n=1 Tax=Streptomyces sp. MRC013 TaxID=2898276 RepID=UPI0020269834|nr:sugar transferase [Streptomyces sp. MRC013]URM90521.1 sugar transferase [Streptomyces sp. MRC013]
MHPKRILDLTLGSVLLVLAAPALLAAAAARALRRPPGGVFLRETTTGLHGRPFTLRTLPVRRLRLDALSRLPHVVRGEMSLVGPAPLAPGAPGAGAAWRHRVKPGLTGLAQVRRGSPLPWDEPLLLDQHYVEHHGMGLDAVLLLRTPAALIGAARRRGDGRRRAHPSDADHRVRGYSAAE